MTDLPVERTSPGLALDVDDLVDALALARQLRPWFGVAKVGLELFSAVGPDAIAAVRDDGFDVFVDLKLHDIPTTVGGAARVIGALGAQYLTLHAAGGVAMLRAGVEGFEHGAAAAGHARADRARGHRADERRRLRRRTSSRSGSRWPSKPAAPASCARPPTPAGPQSGSAAATVVCPASARPGTGRRPGAGGHAGEALAAAPTARARPRE